MLGCNLSRLCHSLTHPPAVCDVAVRSCVSVSVCLELLLFRSPGWMIITTRSKETSLLCLRGASLTGEGGKNRVQRRVRIVALLRKEGNERRIIFHRALCVCVRAETWPVGVGMGEVIACFDIFGPVSLTHD